MLDGMCIGNCVERQNLSRWISGTNTPQSEFYKTKVSKFCVILMYSVTGWLKLEDRTLSLLISKQRRP